MPITDQALVTSLQASSAEAFRTLVDRHGRMLYRVAFRITGSQQDAKDVVQETFLRAHREVRRFELRSLVGTWLYRIAANTAVDLLRARRREADWPEGQETKLTAPDPRSDRQAESSEIQSRPDRALDDLSAQERTAFVLRHYEGRSPEEIAG